MIRKIVDYKKLDKEIVKLLLEKFPDGYDDHHIISFKNSNNQLIEAVEIRTENVIYLVKICVKLEKALDDFGTDDINLINEADSLNLKDLD